MNRGSPALRYSKKSQEVSSHYVKNNTQSVISAKVEAEMGGFLKLDGQLI